MVQCSYKQCTREAGHDGPHGYEAMPGLILVPHGDGSMPEEKSHTATTPCGSCGGLLSLKRYIEGPGGEFSCTSCDQHYIVHRDGRIGSTLTTLWGPTNPGDSRWLEYVDHTCNEWLRDIALREEVGIETPQAEIDSIEAERAKAMRDHEQAKPKSILERIKSWTGNTK